jgi:hypothetical protein
MSFEAYFVQLQEYKLPKPPREKGDRLIFLEILGTLGTLLIILIALAVMATVVFLPYGFVILAFAGAPLGQVHKKEIRRGIASQASRRN